MRATVLHLLSSFNQGGSEGQAIRLAANLSETGEYDVSLAALNGEGVLRERAEAFGFRNVSEFPIDSFFGISFARQILRFRDFLRSNRVHLIHTHDFYTNVFSLVAASNMKQSRVIASKRETEGTRSRAQTIVENLVFRRANFIVANSTAVRQYLMGHGVCSEKIGVIYNGVDLARFTESTFNRQEVLKHLSLPQEPGVRFITLLANLHLEVKNQSMLLRAAKRIIDQHPNIHFVFAGEGRLRKRYEDEARSLNIKEHAHFIGRCNNVPELLGVSFAGVLTSRAEGFSNAILEYMASGLPVVATDVGGASEAVLHEKTGFLVPSDNSDSLADKLIWLLDNSEKAGEMGIEGRNVAETKFSNFAQLQKTIELYKELIPN